MRYLALPLLSGIAALTMIASCGSDEDKPANNPAMSGGAAGSAGSGQGGLGTGGTTTTGGTSAGTNSSGGVAGSAFAGANNAGAQAGGASGAAGASGAGAGGSSGGPSIASIACDTNEDCTPACQAYGWPEGRCNAEPDGYCSCLSESGSPTCQKGTTTGCPPETFCRQSSFCITYGDGGDGAPCPDGNECQIGYICIGYGNPLPNGERTACRKMCDPGNPTPDCKCHPAGFCEELISGAGGAAGAGGSSGAAGSSGAGGNTGCATMIPNAGCADAFDNTIDFQSGDFGACAHWNDMGPNKGWIVYDANKGLHIDLETGLGWISRVTPSPTSQAEAAAFCESFSYSTLTDWRLPTIDEARSLAGGCADTAPGGECPLKDPDCLLSSCVTADKCTSCQAQKGPNGPGGYYCRAEVRMCNSFHTSSLCTDCSTPKDWHYGVGNGNFYAGSVDDKNFYPVCVTENVGNAIPCR